MNQERLLKILVSPHVSEKAAIAAEKNNQYVFEVTDCASKSEIKDAVEFLFNTKVKQVRVLKVKAKKKLFRGVEGKRKGWRKAYITLQADQKLDVVAMQ